MPAGSSSADHISKLKPKASHKKGCVTKHEGGFKDDRCAYRYQGYQKTVSTAKKKRLYELDFTRDPHKSRLPKRMLKELKLGHARKKSNFRLPVNPSKSDKKRAWCFDGDNFKVAYKPYNHNYHHILPFDALKQLNWTELNLLQQSGYNVNDGINLIILPCTAAYAYAVMLPAHPYNHPKYNKDVKTIINEIKKDVSRNSKSHKVTDKNKNNFKKKLETWEDKEYWVIVKYGKGEAKKRRAAHINQAPMAQH